MKKITQFLSPAAILLVILASSGCYYDNEQDLYDANKACDTATVTYSGVVSTIIGNNCLNSHSGTASSGGGFNLEGHTNLKKYADNGQLMGTITHGSSYSPMPKGQPKLSNCNIAKVQAWVSAGAPNN